jgi:gamma-D-glutamyl-L-lysine dipeptidyl-peptidase
MSYAVCCVPVAPIRTAPDHRTEMTSQLLFGEHCTINDNDKTGWVKITCKADGYVGWCQLPHVKQISEEEYSFTAMAVAADWVNEISYNNQAMFVPLGSLLWAEKNNIEFLCDVWYPAKIKRNEETITEIVFKFLNTAYLWGGRSVFGIDCSGFSQAVYKFLNIALLRDATQQATQGELVNFLQEARCGDLAFFDDEEGKIIHVGILLNNYQVIHASSRVRVDKIDNEGIINSDTGERAQRLRIIKRYF